MLHVLAHLSPKDLLTTSAVSRCWRDRALDEKLWRSCFAREGWVVDRSRMADFEELAKKRPSQIAKGLLPDKSQGTTLERRGSRKRKTEEAFSEGEQVGGLDGAADGSIVGNTSGDESSDSMEGVQLTANEPASDAAALREEDEMSLSDALMDRRLSTDSAASFGSDSLRRVPADEQLKIKPTLFQSGDDSADPKLSWPYLYKQRCRLEKNWETGHYRMFSLPHPRHLNEGHKECVYTIQHTSKHLVSGSRDRTIRIWDLRTYRLKRNPLVGHAASVLCLQFDERPEHDLIVSGGSDAYVIVWRFSTGEIIKKMTQAHDESVLNLRFDERFIVTCSKDKTIKIWNRNALTTDDPMLPAHSLKQFQDGRTQLNLAESNLIAQYTNIMTLDGHHAAVNAVMIHGNTIVSASGDRTIKAWDINKGSATKTYSGHTKGIACVQFDGRRIVSGSSDNTVRIFDAETTSEIACLSGHQNLVRTVQARFGDLEITTSEELEAEAREADNGLIRAMENGMPPPSAERTRIRNAGSSNPEEMLSYGNHIPPGGGGSRWAKIVSGSYDENVIVWKRDRDGRWKEKLTLNQGLLLNNRNHRRRMNTHQPGQANTLSLQTGDAAVQTQQAQNLLAQAQGHLVQVNAVLQQPMAPGQAHALPNSQMVALHAAQAHLTGQLANAHVQQQHHHQHNLNGAVQHPNSPVQPAVAPAQAQQNPAPPAPAAAAAAHQAHHAQRGENNSNRVFKLQFDARRIICCSQNKTIVGWDFANGEKELERIGGWSVETA